MQKDHLQESGLACRNDVKASAYTQDQAVASAVTMAAASEQDQAVASAVTMAARRNESR